MRKPSLSQHPLFAAKATGLRTRVMRFTPSWFSVTMVSGERALLGGTRGSRFRAGQRASTGSRRLRLTQKVSGKCLALQISYTIFKT
jgi:hypothetical protein